MGATAVEFAMGSVFFIVLLIGIFDLALVMFADGMLSRATSIAARSSRVASLDVGADGGSAAFREALCRQTQGRFDCSRFIVEVRTFDNFADASTSLDGELPDDLTELESFSRGNPDEIVAFRVYYEWPVLLVSPAWSMADRNDGRKLLVATSVVRNEPVPD